MTENSTSIAPENHAAIRAASQRLRDWLLQGPAQLRNGAQTGAVAGSLDEFGRAKYAYAEITGYYLHWLAELASEKIDSRVATAAQAALDWFCSACVETGLPATRIAQFDDSPDWRNDAQFCFDLGMLSNGVVSALQEGLARDVKQHDAVLDSLNHVIAGLDKHAGPDGLQAALPLSVHELPERWSTRGGAFLAKPAVRILHSARLRPLPDELDHACQREIERCTAISALAERPSLLHPLLYAAEGLAWAAPERAADIAAMLNHGLDLADADGRLPEDAEGDTGPRNDVAAQALRLGVWLRVHAPEHAPDPPVMERLAALVASEIRADGSIPFRPHGGAGDTNIWCALFAEQALRWWLDLQDGSATARAEFLV